MKRQFEDIDKHICELRAKHESRRKVCHNLSSKLVPLKTPKPENSFRRDLDWGTHLCSWQDLTGIDKTSFCKFKNS